jgi:hypothetical protein
LLQAEYKTIDGVNKIITACQAKKNRQNISEEDKEQESAPNTETPAKPTVKIKEELLYLGGFILIIAIVASLFKKIKAK